MVIGTLLKLLTGLLICLHLLCGHVQLGSLDLLLGLCCCYFLS
jgi:hypothetical protein